jgi:flagellar biosynthesis chaperone FliJ
LKERSKVFSIDKELAQNSKTQDEYKQQIDLLRGKGIEFEIDIQALNLNVTSLEKKNDLQFNEIGQLKLETAHNDNQIRELKTVHTTELENVKSRCHDEIEKINDNHQKEMSRLKQLLAEREGEIRKLTLIEKIPLPREKGRNLVLDSDSDDGADVTMVDEPPDKLVDDVENPSDFQLGW